mmetsp:Transcript_12752/g.33679  ORF Transcript_12752/g.33679 Transcript_12752/m.33679 type:complete len:202 (-) Transcript_12752:504-1109(-)
MQFQRRRVSARPSLGEPGRGLALQQTRGLRAATGASRAGLLRGRDAAEVTGDATAAGRKSMLSQLASQSSLMEPASLGTERVRRRAPAGNGVACPGERWMNVFFTRRPMQPSSASTEGDIRADQWPSCRISGVEAGGSSSVSSDSMPSGSAKMLERACSLPPNSSSSTSPTAHSDGHCTSPSPGRQCGDSVLGVSSLWSHR